MDKIFALKNWSFYIFWNKKAVNICGYVYGNPKFEEGTWINTSPIYKIEVLEECLRVHTMNSVYECAYETYAGGEMSFAKEDFFPMPEPKEENRMKVEVAIKEKVAARIAREKESLTTAFSEEEDCLVFEFSSNEDYYIKAVYAKKDGEEFYSRDYHVHVGTFQDSVLIEDIYGDEEYECDYRFFPYAGNSLEFYSFSRFEGRIYVRNVGDKTLSVKGPFGHYMIPAQTAYAVGEGENLGRVEDDKMVRVDKHNIWQAEVTEEGMVAYSTPKAEPGKPRYEWNEHVMFDFNGKLFVGKIVVVDSFGTFEQNEEPSYDIFCEKENTLYKHVRESQVVAKVKMDNETNENT